MVAATTPPGWDDPIPDIEACSVCGADLEWTDCWECHGEGEFDWYADNPNEYGPDDVETCGTCNGAGGYLECPVVDSSPAHRRARTA